MSLTKSEIIAAVGELLTAESDERRREVTRTVVTAGDDAAKVILLLSWCAEGVLDAIDLLAPFPPEERLAARSRLVAGIVANIERTWTWD